MADVERAAAIHGKTIRFKWTEGPTKGKTYEHVFHPDGTVEWREPGGQQGGAPKERPPYGAMKVADDIYAVSYLAPSGFTLSVVLNFGNRSIVGYASGAKDWFPLRGILEVVG